MTTESSFNTISAAALLAMAKTTDENGQHGPAAHLRSLIEEVEDELNCTEAEACEYIAQRGPLWNGGCEGGIGVRVREDEDGVHHVQWSGRSDAYTWCGLRDLLQAISNGNLAPGWFERDWVEVWHYDAGHAYGGCWGTRKGA